MKNQTWKHIDKSKWPDGPWHSEPDKMQWTDETTGLPCLIVRTPHGGHLCGYVGVSKSHPCHGKEYDYDSFNPEVHGGLTFAGKCSGKEHGICHVVEEGEDDDIWWLGFDCAHLGDHSPFASYERGFDELETYRTVAYVQRECASLAQQLKALDHT